MSASDRYGEGRGDGDPSRIEAEIARTRAEMDETLDEIQHRFSPGQLFDDAMDYVRAGPGDFASNLGEAVRNNPVPVALVGVGLAWLMLARNRGDQRRGAQAGAGDLETYGDVETYGTTADFDPYYDEPYYPGEGYTGEGPKEEMVTGSTISMARDKMNELRESAASTTGRVRESVGDAVGRVRDTAGRTRDRLEQAASGARERMHSMSGGVGDRAGRAREAAYERARQARGRFDYVMNEQPLVIGGIGLAIGAALATALPMTRREDEWMGGARDEVLERASVFGKEKLRSARHVAEATADAAVEEADRQGLSVEGGKRQARQVKDKVGKVAAAARNTAKEEASKEGLTTAKQDKPEGA